MVDEDWFDCNQSATETNARKHKRHTEAAHLDAIIPAPTQLQKLGDLLSPGKTKPRGAFFVLGKAGE